MKINKTIRKLKKYIIRNFADIILIEIPVIVFFVISVLLLKYGLSINPSVKLQDTFSVIFLLFVPVIIFIIFKCLKLMKKKILSIIVNILSFILIPVSLFFYIYFSGAIYVASLFNAEFTYRTPSVSEYSTEIKNYPKMSTEQIISRQKYPKMHKIIILEFMIPTYTNIVLVI